jgi:thiamine monophosphate synthase
MLQKIIIINNPNEINIKRIKQLKAELLLRDFKQIKFKDEITAKLRKNNIRFFVYNNAKLLLKYKTNLLYISSYNRCFYKHLKLVNKKIFILGGAHNAIEINRKINQGCDAILLSRVFETKDKKGFLDINKFNYLSNIFPVDFYALGGINQNNIKKIKNSTRSKGICVMSAYKNLQFKF